MEQMLSLILMNDEFKSAGFTNESEAFAGELNKKLAEFGLMLKPTAGTDRPSVCPSCGAQLSHAEPDEGLKCSSCGYIVSAV